MNIPKALSSVDVRGREKKIRFVCILISYTSCYVIIQLLYNNLRELFTILVSYLVLLLHVT